VLTSSIVVLAMSGGVAAAAADTKSVLEVVAIAEVDFGGILGTRAGAVAVGMTSDCKVLFTAQTVQKHCPRKRHTLMAGSSAYAHGRHC
jgi:predicted acylesterase/phospholipase RssA